MFSCLGPLGAIRGLVRTFHGGYGGEGVSCACGSKHAPLGDGFPYCLLGAPLCCFAALSDRPAPLSASTLKSTREICRAHKFLLVGKDEVNNDCH